MMNRRAIKECQASLLLLEIYARNSCTTRVLRFRPCCIASSCCVCLTGLFSGATLTQLRAFLPLPLFFVEQENNCSWISRSACATLGMRTTLAQPLLPDSRRTTLTLPLPPRSRRTTVTLPSTVVFDTVLSSFQQPRSKCCSRNELLGWLRTELEEWFLSHA